MNEYALGVIVGIFAGIFLGVAAYDEWARRTRYQRGVNSDLFDHLEKINRQIAEWKSHETPRKKPAAKGKK